MEAFYEQGETAQRVLHLATRGASALEAGRAGDALELLSRALDLARQAETERERAVSFYRITVERHGRWFRLDSSAPVDFERHAALARLLAALATQRTEAPGQPLSKAELVAAGWPQEKLVRSSARNRLHVALNALRKRGLRDLLLTTKQGYLLRPDIELVLVDAADRAA